MSTATGTRLRLSNEICEALRREAVEGLKILRKRGAEVGGVLTRRAAAGSASMIDGFEPIPCEHRYGPSYRLSPLDRENFRARCRELRERQGVDIAGFFRSSTRESLQVTAEDAALVRELLSEAAGVVLIQPFLSGDAIFRVFQPAQDSDWREFEEFRCFGDEVVVAPRPVPPPAAVRMGAAAAVPVMTRAAAPEIAPRTSFGEPRPRKVFARDWMSVLLVISFLAFASALLVVATRSLWNNAPQTARASSPDLAMQIAWQGDSLRLTWDRSLPSVRNSTGANLQIQDGKQYREVALDSTQVAQAVVYYTPASDDVTFHLNIRGREPAEVAGIARMLAVRPGAVPPPVSQPVRSAPRREVQPRPEASDPPPTRGAPQQPLPTGAEASPLPITPGVPSQPPVSSRPNAAPSTEEKKAEVSEIRKPVETEPPAPAPPKAADAVPLRAQNVPAAPVIPPAVAPRPPLTSVSPGPHPPDLPTPAHPVKRVLPVRQTSTAPAVLTPMTVTVQVSIDKQGKVVEAHALHSQSQYWSGRAVEAALQWQFEPAKLHGQSIPSTSEIDFKFNPR